MAKDGSGSTRPAAAAGSASPTPIIVARRNDGLGGRLSALLNAMRMADILGAEWRLVWPADPNLTHGMAIPPAEEIWTKRFIEERIVAEETVRGSVTFRGHSRPAAAWLENLNGKPFATPWQPLWWYVDDKAARGPLSKELGKLGFTPPYKRAIRAARKVKLPAGAVAIHVRAGDIVYGRYRRYWVHTTKAVPYPVVAGAIAQLRSEGHPVIVFGQERDALTWLAGDDAGVLLAQDLMPAGLTGAPAALAEMVLMSRCTMAVAGPSVFAAIACSLAGGNVTPIGDVLSAQEQAALVDEAGEIPGGAAAAAHAQLYAYVVTFGSATAEEKLRRLESVFALDPDNPLVPIAMAAALGDQGKVEEAEQVLARAAQHAYPADMGTLESTIALRMRTWFLLEKLLPSIEELASAGSAHATALWDAAVAAGVHERTPRPGGELVAR